MPTELTDFFIVLAVFLLFVWGGIEPVRVFRHRVRGTIYHVVGIAEGSFSTGDLHLDHQTFVVYRGADGHLSVRPEREFFDGRFEELRQ